MPERRRTRFRSVRIAALLGGLGCLAFVGAGIALAEPGDFDRGFSGNGVARAGFGPHGGGYGYAYAVAVQPNERIVIAGNHVRFGGNYGQSAGFGIARFRRSGRLDRSFGDGGTVQIDFGELEWASDVAVQDDGRIVVAGQARVGGRYLIGMARLRPSGDLDPSFGNGGKQILDPFEPPAQAWAYTLALEPGGDILVGGTEFVSEQDNPGFVARLEPNGDLDPSFADGGVKTINLPVPGTDVNTLINQMIVDSRGRIAAAASADNHNAQGGDQAVMLRLRSNGAYDPSFSGNGLKGIPGRDSALLSIAAAPHGRLVGAGRVGPYGHGYKMLVTRVEGSGPFDRSFAGDGVKTTKLDIGRVNVVAHEVMMQRNGKPLIAAEWYREDNGRDLVVRLRPNGVLDHSFSGNGKTTLTSIVANHDAAMQANGKILLSGAGAGGKAFVARLKNRERPFVAP